MKKIGIYLVLFILVFSSCKKYEEGPLISLRSKEKRLCQTWNLTQGSLNGDVETMDSDEYEYWDFSKDGTLLVTMSYADWGIETLDLDWEWSDDKEQIIITETWEEYKSLPGFSLNRFKTETETLEMNIIKLKYKDLILEYSEDGDVYRFEFEQKK